MGTRFRKGQDDETKTFIASLGWAKTLAARFRTACALNLLLLRLLLMLPFVAQAQYNYATNSGNLTITGYTGSGGDVAIPSMLKGLPVTRIGDGAFSYGSSLNGVYCQGDAPTRRARLLASVVHSRRYGSIRTFCLDIVGFLVGFAVVNEKRFDGYQTL
jgi:hypothetical protein